MDRTDEIGKEGICYQCGEKKYIKWYQGSKVFCEDCFNDKYPKKHHMKNVNENAGLDENDNYIHRREQNQPKQKKIR